MKPLAGVFLGVFASLAAAAPLSWHGSMEIAAGRGERGPWQQNESRYDYVDDGTVALDERGTLAVAWVDQARKDVFLRRFSAEGAPLGGVVNVSRSPATFSWLPRVAHSDQNLFVLWQEIIFSGGSHGGDILFARSGNGGASFGTPLNLSSSAGGDGKGRISRDVWHNGSLDIAAGADGAVYTVWTDYEGALWLSVSGDAGASFSTPRRLAGDGERPARAPSVAIGNDRTVYLAWTVGEDPAADIRIAHSTDGGLSFSAARLLARTPAFSDAPKLAVGPQGTLHLAWSEGERIFYSRSADGARSFQAPRDISGAGAAFPSLEVGANGALLVLWERVAKTGGQPRGLALALSRDGGKTFAAPQSVPGSADAAGGRNGSHQGLLMKKLAANSRGDIAVVNSALKEGERSRVWLMQARTGR